MTESKLMTEAVVKISPKGGRGFIVNAADDPAFIITAAHCVPGGAGTLVTTPMQSLPAASAGVPEG